MWRVIIWSVLVPGRAQYWDTEGLRPPVPSEAGTHSLGLSLVKSLGSEPYDIVSQLKERERRMAVENEDSTSSQGQGRHRTKMAVVGKCCPVGQNLSLDIDEDGSRKCASSAIPFQPIFYDFNASGIWDYDVNEFETIVGNPCPYGKYLLDPSKYSEDEFYLLRNGSLIAPYHKPRLLNPKDFCMEAFWSPSSSLEPLVLPLVCFPRPLKAPVSPQSAWDVLIAIVMLVSVPFLVATSVSHWSVRELWTATGARHCQALGAHTACLALAFFSLAVTQLSVSHLSHTLCIVAAYTIQFSFLACFFWLNILCVDTFLNVKMDVTRDEAERKRCIWCGCEEIWRRIFDKGWWLWGWGAPSIITLITLLLDQTPGLPVTLHKPNLGADACWFQSDASTWFYFYGPISVLLIANMSLFILTARSLSRQDKALNPLAALGSHQLPLTDPDVTYDGTTGRERWKKYKIVFKLCFVLFLVMGLSWTLEVLSWVIGGTSSIWIFSDLFNAFQGIIIFFIFMRPPVLLIIWRRLTKTFPWLPWRSRDEDMDVISSRTSIGCNGVRRFDSEPV